MNKEQFQELLKAGQLGEAIDKLQQIAQSSSDDWILKVFLLKRQFNRMEEDKSSGAISSDDANKIRATISSTALDYFDWLQYAVTMPTKQESDSLEESPFDGVVTDDPDIDVNFSGGDVTNN